MSIDRQHLIAAILKPYRDEREWDVVREYGRELRAASDDHLIREARLNHIPEHEIATATRRDVWVPACGGTETPARARDGRTYLYVWNPGRAQHGWLDMGTDIVTFDNPNGDH